MIFDKAKTKEMVFHRPHPNKFDMPDPLDGIAQEHAAKLLGVMFTGKLSFENHVVCVDGLFSACLFVKITAKSGPSNTAAAHGLWP